MLGTWLVVGTWVFDLILSGKSVNQQVATVSSDKCLGNSSASSRLRARCRRERMTLLQEWRNRVLKAALREAAPQC